MVEIALDRLKSGVGFYCMMARTGLKMPDKRIVSNSWTGTFIISLVYSSVAVMPSV